MPNRILREGILTSRKVCVLDWPEEVFYRRLISVVDDYGRFHADCGMLRAACYPRQLSKVADADIGAWLACVERAGLVHVYVASDGERYLEVANFGQHVRAKKSKFPEPVSNSAPPSNNDEHLQSTCSADATQTQSTCDAGAQHVQANDRLDVFGVEDVEIPPIPPTPPDGDAVGAGPKKRTRSPAVAIGTWLEAVKAKGELPIPADDPVFDYAEKAGIPTEYVYLAWREFQAKNTGGTKRYSDWRQAFRNCVRGSWYGLWYAKPDGDYALTTKGIQAQRVFDAAPKLEAVA